MKENILEILLKISGKTGSVLHPDNTITKLINGVLVTKQGVAKKDLSWDWIENVNPNDIDLRYFNKDFTKKNELE